MKKVKFSKEICVRREVSEGYPIIVGTPDDLKGLDAEDGDEIAIYTLDRIETFRQSPRLEKRR